MRGTLLASSSGMFGIDPREDDCDCNEHGHSVDCDCETCMPEGCMDEASSVVTDHGDMDCPDIFAAFERAAASS